MNPTSVDRVARVIGEVVGIDVAATIGPDTGLIGHDLSLDSTAVLELLVGLENEWAVELDPDEMLKADAMRTVGTLARFLDTLAKGDA